MSSFLRVLVQDSWQSVSETAGGYSWMVMLSGFLILSWTPISFSHEKLPSSSSLYPPFSPSSPAWQSSSSCSSQHLQLKIISIFIIKCQHHWNHPHFKLDLTPLFLICNCILYVYPSHFCCFILVCVLVLCISRNIKSCIDKFYKNKVIMILNIKVREKKWVSMGKYQYDMVITKNSKLNSYNHKCSASIRWRKGTTLTLVLSPSAPPPPPLSGALLGSVAPCSSSSPPLEGDWTLYLKRDSRWMESWQYHTSDLPLTSSTKEKHSRFVLN